MLRCSNWTALMFRLNMRTKPGNRQYLRERRCEAWLSQRCTAMVLLPSTGTWPFWSAHSIADAVQRKGRPFAKGRLRPCATRGAIKRWCASARFVKGPPAAVTARRRADSSMPITTSGHRKTPASGRLCRGLRWRAENDTWRKPPRKREEGGTSGKYDSRCSELSFRTKEPLLHINR